MFAQAREKARQAACISNGKQIGTAVMMYLQDYDEVYPSVDLQSPSKASPVLPTLPTPDGGTYTGQMVWALQLYPYIKSKQVFLCPNDDEPGYTVGTTQYKRPFAMSYGINESMAFFGSTDGAGFGPTYLAAATLADVRFPSSTYYIGDTHSRQSPTWGQGSQTVTSSSTFNRLRFPKPCGAQTNPVDGTGGVLALAANAPNPDACTRHNGGNTMIFTDGHAKWMKWSQYLATQAKWQRLTD